MPTTQDDLLSRSELARMLGVSEWQVRSLELRGELHPVKIGSRTVKYVRSDVQRFIDSRYVEAAEQE